MFVRRKGFTTKKGVPSRGFTLIELLVVIAIIGLLSTMAIVALGTARLKSRDARRVADLKQIQTALELYAGDSNGIYPPTTTAQLGDSAHVCLDSTGFHAANGCTNPYIATFPRDPKSGFYSYWGSGTDYSVLASLEGTVNGLSGLVSATPNSGIAASSVVLNIPFNTPGCYPSGSALGTRGEAVTISRNSTSTYLDASGVLQYCLPNTLRVTPNGALMEPARTNLCLYSEQLNDGSWTVGGGSISPNTDFAPDGMQTADTVVRGTGGGNAVYPASFNGTVALYTYSVWVRAGTTAVAVYNFFNAGFPAATCKILSGPGVLGADPGAGGLCSITGLSTTQWTRISVTATLSAASGWQVLLYPETAGSGTVGLTLKMWGAQIELGSYATSYILTTSTAATRNADQVSVTNPFNDTQGCAIATVRMLPGHVGVENARIVGNGSSSNDASPLFENTAAQVGSWDGTGQLITAAAFDGSAAVRVAGCWGAGGRSLYNVSAGYSGAGAYDGTMFGAQPWIYIGGNGTNPAYYLGGFISDFRACSVGTYGQGGCQ